MTRFPYRKFSGSLRPIASVILAANGLTIETGMLVDSGADISMIPLRLGRALGFHEEASKIKNLRGISGYGVPYLTQVVKLSIAGQTFPAEIAWALTEDAPLLLGRRNVFTKFRITFDETKAITEFVPNPQNLPKQPRDKRTAKPKK